MLVYQTSTHRAACINFISLNFGWMLFLFNITDYVQITFLLWFKLTVISFHNSWEHMCGQHWHQHLSKHVVFASSTDIGLNIRTIAWNIGCDIRHQLMPVAAIAIVEMWSGVVLDSRGNKFWSWYVIISDGLSSLPPRRPYRCAVLLWQLFYTPTLQTKCPIFFSSMTFTDIYLLRKRLDT